MLIKNAVIVIDSGFSQDVVAQVKNLIGFYDLNSCIAVTGAPLIIGLLFSHFFTPWVS